ncbi:16S rRNA (cytosine(1402)-N(4))-methyltransferase RsmH [Candidatus Dojkabacteria bacterium]|nr:16S rRNA (cytosine(1402)-N(4))-methyltransferase RsmH [Candidatus Dojkabacteria bacterium]
MNTTNCPLKTHKPVLLKPSLEALDLKPDGFYIDCTLGEGGHSIEIFKKLSTNGTLLSIDQDQEAIRFVKEYYPKETAASNWIIVNENFEKIETILENLTVKSAESSKKVLPADKVPDGIIADLGLSSRQLEIETRGFSYLEHEQPLDMRMDERLSIKANDLLLGLTEFELEKLLRTYGEERYAKSIARMIKKETEADGVATVGDLVKIIYKALPSKNLAAQRKHPARRVFQAIRIAVNDELHSLENLLESSKRILKPGGKLVVITFHSLEEKIVKKFIKKYNLDDYKILVPDEAELAENPRASSAKAYDISLSGS